MLPDPKWLDEFHKDLESFLREVRGWKDSGTSRPAEVKALNSRLDEIERFLLAQSSELEAVRQRIDDAREAAHARQGELEQRLAADQEQAQDAQRRADESLAGAERLRAQVQSEKESLAADRAAAAGESRRIQELEARVLAELEAGRKELEEERRRLDTDASRARAEAEAAQRRAEEIRGHGEAALMEAHQVKAASELESKASAESCRMERRHADEVRLAAESAISKALDLEKELLRRHQEELEAWGSKPRSTETPRPRSRDRLVFWSGLAACLTAAAGLAVWRMHPSPAARSHLMPFSHPTGLVWTGKELWVSDWLEGAVFRVGLDKGRLRVLGKHDLPEFHITGLAAAGGSFFVADSWRKTISLLRFDAGAWSVTRTWPSPGPNPSALHADGRYLYSADAVTRKVYMHAIDDQLTVLETYQADFAPAALHAGQDFLWLADAEQRVLRRCRWTRGALKGEALSPPDVESGRQPVSCMAKADGTFWIGRDGSNVLIETTERALRAAD